MPQRETLVSGNSSGELSINYLSGSDLVGESKEDFAFGKQVQTFLDQEIRPLLNADAGDIEVEFVHGGDARLRFLGHCQRCMFRSNCSEHVVLGKLREQFPNRSFSISNVRMSAQALKRLQTALGD